MVACLLRREDAKQNVSQGGTEDGREHQKGEADRQGEVPAYPDAASQKYRRNDRQKAERNANSVDRENDVLGKDRQKSIFGYGIYPCPCNGHAGHAEKADTYKDQHRGVQPNQFTRGWLGLLFPPRLWVFVVLLVKFLPRTTRNIVLRCV